MRRFALLAVVVVIILSVTIPQLLAQQDNNDAVVQQSTNSALQLVDTEPLTGAELGLEMPITLYFDRPVDCSTVGNGLTISPPIAGTVTCDDTTLTFTPDGAFDRANTYTLQLDSAIRGQDGAQLFEAVSLNFDTVGFVQVSETFPATESLDIQLNTSITVIFNRPIVALNVFEEEDNFNPLVISPAIEGTGEWVSSSIYLFEPDEQLQANTQYTVTIEENLTSEDGAILPEDYTFNFFTQPPQILDFSPFSEQTNAPLDQTVQVRFNLEMDQQSVEDAFSLTNTLSEDEVAGTFEWAEDGAGFRFIPDEDLEIESSYLVSIDSEMVRGLNGGEGGLTGTSSWTFDTVPFPAIESTSPSDDGSVRAYGGFVIYFASPMKQDQFADFITIEPEPEFEPRYYWRSWSDSVEVAFQPYASAEYTITIAAGLEDEYGNTIDEEYIFSYTTLPFQPEINLRTVGSVGFYNAERDPTALFVTYRNVDEFDVSLYEIEDDVFNNFLIREGRYGYISSGIFQDEDNLLSRFTVNGTEVPENALRFDLLEFNESVNGIACPASLPTRLFNGTTAIVTSDPDPVRARSAPVTGEIVDLLYVDYALPILDEPVCGSDGLTWYPVQLRDGTAVWVAESVEDEYLIAPLDGTQTAEVPITVEEGQGLDPGAYYIRLDSETGVGYNTDHVMVVSNVNITLKHTNDSMLIWATDVQTGLPLPDAPVAIYGQTEEFVPIATGITNVDGVLEVDLPEASPRLSRRLVIIDTDTHYGIGSTDFDSGISPYQFAQSYSYYPNEYRIYLYSDRPVYRPGQPVYLRGVVREQDDIAYTTPDIDSINMQIANGFGETIYDGPLDINEFGTFSLQLDLADDTRLGYYSAIASLPSTREYYGDLTGRARFNVAEYRLPEFLVDVTANTPEVVQGETLSVTVDSTFFFGGSVSDATVEYSVIAEDYFFTYEGEGRYDFIDYNFDSGPSAFYASSDNGTLATGTATTDAQGEFTIEIPADLADASQSQRFVVEATVRDETGQSVSGRGTVIVHQGEFYIGARANNYVSTANEESIINLIAVDWDSQPLRNQRLEVEVVQRVWSSVQERDENGRTVWRYEVEEIVVADGNERTNRDGEAQFTFTPEEGGSYKIYVTGRDDAGNTIRTSTYVWVSSRNYVSWRQQNSNRIDLVADSESYTVGDTAEILIASPFQGTAEALITVERGDILSYERITMETNSVVYELPITQDHAPNVYVSVVIVKGVDENNPVAGFRVGYVEFTVDPERYELNIDISSNVDRTSPQETITYTIQTTDWAGTPVPAEVGVAVTDLASLSLAPDPSRPIFNYFYSDQSLSVETTTPLTLNADQLTQEVLDTVKGGGGGIAAEGLIEIRGEFIDTPYWNPTLVTDENGLVTFDVRLPDNLTTWRMDARAYTLAPDGNMLVGQNTFDILSTKPILIRPVTPRFFIVGDEVVIAAVVNNNTESPQDVIVTMNYDGVTLLNGRNNQSSQQVRIPADSRERVTWRVSVDDVEQARFSFTADAGNFNDGAISGISIDDEGTLPVYSYAPPEVGNTVGSSGVLETAESRVETFYLPERFDVDEGFLTVEVEQSLAAATLDSLQALDAGESDNSSHYTVSRMLPNIMSYRALEEFGLVDDDLEAMLNRNSNFGIQKLVSEQKADGGWGWYFSSRSNPSTTAYVLLGLYEAQQQGFTVPQQTLNRGVEYLQANLVSIDQNTTTWRANRQVFTLYVLARMGQPDVARTEVSYRNRDDISLYAKALLAETYWYIDPLDASRADVLLNELLNSVSISAAGAHWQEPYIDYWNWNTDTRTTTMALNAFILWRPESDLIPNIVRYLMIQRRVDRWESTQETTWAVMSLTNWMIASGELNPDYAYTVALNGEERISGQATEGTARNSEMLFVEVADLLQGEANRLEFIRTGSNDGNLYYTTYLTAQLPIPDLEPISNGATITRTYSLQSDPENTPITEATVGDIIEVRLTIILSDSMHYVQVYDPLPAGAEGIDPNLTTSAQIGTRPSLNNTSPLRYGWGWWYFSNVEFRDEAAVLNADFLSAGTYEYVYTMRAGVEGTYNVIPPAIREVYFPDSYGRGAGSSFTVNPAQ
ncbi:MAG: Ig-like domain-containing protein [Chloroflexota bacterium]